MSADTIDDARRQEIPMLATTSCRPSYVADSARCVSTYSIVGRDGANGDLGIAVQSKFLAVGAVVPWARAGVGAIATQSYANTSYGPRGLELLGSGKSAEEVVAALTADDAGAAQRQVGIVDAQGRSATFSGAGCHAWAGGIAGPEFAAQGNILVGEDTVRALADTFQRSSGPLAHRLLGALAAGQQAGGDRRGQQSAALLVVRAGGGYAGFNDRYIDLRVDDYPDPIVELGRLLAQHELYFLPPEPADFIPVDGALASEIQALLTSSGDYHGAITGVFDEATRAALERYSGRENLEERLASDARIDRKVLEYLRAHAA
jgi:uncharacterized Ntn-hydrolase superfamily protein